MKYTLIEIDKRIEIMLNIRPSDYTYVTDLEEFKTNLALGIIDVEHLILNEKQVDEDIEALIQPEVLCLADKMLIELVEEEMKTASIVTPITETEEEVSSLTEEHYIEEKESQPVKKEEKVKEESVSKEKTSFFSKIFGRKQQEVVEVAPDISEHLLNRVRRDTSRGDVLREHLISHGYLTEEQLRRAEATIVERQRYGHKSFLIQTCRELKFLNEDEAAKALAYTSSKEILSKTIIMSRIEEIAELNRELIKYTKEFFVCKVDTYEKILIICKDLSKTVNLSYLDDVYHGYTYSTTDVVEGVTSEIWQSIAQTLKRKSA